MELWDLYYENGEKTDLVIDRKDGVPDGFFHLAVIIQIFNSKGELLIQQRSELKKYDPGAWSCSAAGSVLSGESPIEAILRELYEELGIKLKGDKIKQCGVGISQEKHALYNIYYTILDVDIKNIVLQKGEVKAVRWVSIDELREIMKEGNCIGKEYFYLAIKGLLEDKKKIEKDVYR